MLDSFTSLLLGFLSDITQNPVSVVIFGILSLLVIALILASLFISWRKALVGIKILEPDERPSSLLLWILAIIIIVKSVQGFLIQPFIVDGGSMLPTYHNEEFLFVDKLSYRLGNPERGDVVIFKLYEDTNNPYNGKYLIKRVLGLPGERVVVQNGITTIYNKENPQGFVAEEPFVLYKDTNKDTDITLDEDHYFVMGDNRAQSYDSRYWGALEKEDIKGQVLFRIYPFSQLSYEPGRHTYSK